MKTAFFLFIALVWLQTSCFARDFIVKFVQESYRETQGSNRPQMYHAIQVSSKAGPYLSTKDSQMESDRKKNGKK